MEVLLKSQRLTDEQIIQAIKDFACSSSCWTYMPEESVKYTSLAGHPACMIMLEDERVCPIVAVGKNENGTYYVSNIIPKEAGSISPVEYNQFAQYFASSVRNFLRNSDVPLRVSLLIEKLDLKQIISSPIARKFFDQYLAMYPRSHHPADVRRLDIFICIASRFCRKPINPNRLEGYLRVKLQWPDEDARWCRQRVETGLKILSVYKKL
jgi:hypothetical protein